MPEIRTGDTVVVLSGKDAGKRGKVESVARTRRATILTAHRRRARPARPCPGPP